MAKENGMIEYRNKKMIRLFLNGVLCGVIITAAFTYLFAIPANNYHWQTEIWNRGGGAFTMDMKSGRTGWKWLAEPIPDTPPKKPATIVPLSQPNVRTERLERQVGAVDSTALAIGVNRAEGSAR